jgi:hypothetical protein
MRLFIPFLNVGSLCCRPPRAWRVVKENDVSSCARPPQFGGEWCTHVNVYLFDYMKTTGGLEPFAVFSDLFKFAFPTVQQ